MGSRPIVVAVLTFALTASGAADAYPLDGLEASGIRLPVVEAHLRFRAAARYDDMVQVRCWVRDVGSRRVTFGYALTRPGEERLLATAQTSLIAVDSTYAVTTLPADLRSRLVPISDPVRL